MAFTQVVKAQRRTPAVPYGHSEFGRSEFRENGDGVERGDVGEALILQRTMRADVPSESRAGARSEASELATLRSINARLIREIAILKQREAQVQQLADRDGLTGLYNRRRMSEFLTSAIAESSQQQQRFGVLFIDLDGFKHINDRYGHAMGDQLLIAVSGRIATRARTGDLVCRYGGDEFIVLLPRVPDRAAAIDVAATITDLVSLPYWMGYEQLRVTAAVGVALYPDDGDNAAELLHRADELMYRAKASSPDLMHTLALRRAPARRRDDKSKRRFGW
jgi:diguanylate cyclase (GGDEF)-like protein